MSHFAWLNDSFSLTLSQTLLHFLWQGCVLAVAVFLGSCVLRRAAAQIRYAFNVSAVLLMVACLPVTFALISSTPQRELAFHSAAATDHVEPLSIETRDSTADKLASPQTGQENSPSPQASGSDTTTELAPVVGPSQHTASRSFLVLIAPFLSTAYGCGVFVMMFRLAVGLRGGQKLRWSGESIVNPSLLATMKHQAQQLGLKVVPAIAYCNQISIPIVLGVVRPMILLPASLATGLSTDQLRVLISHELAHIRRFDLLVNLIQRVIEAILFFHPAVWYVSRRVSSEREQAADDMVLAAGWPRLLYADALVRMAELSASFRDKRLTARATAIAASGGRSSELKRRVLRLLDESTSPELRMTWRGLALFVVILSVAAFAPLVIRTQAQTGGDQNPKSSEVKKKQNPTRRDSPRRKTTPAVQKAGIATAEQQLIKAIDNATLRASRKIIRSFDDSRKLRAGAIARERLAKRLNEISGKAKKKAKQKGKQAAAFRKFEAIFENRFANQAPVQLTIDGAGNIRYHTGANERLKLKEYTANFKLPARNLRAFAAALRSSKWLEHPITKKRSPHPTRYRLQLTRQAKTVQVNFEDGRQKELQPYRLLIRFIGQLHRQESSLHRLQPKSRGRRSVLHNLNSELKVLHGHANGQLPYLPILDWNRFKPIFQKALLSRVGDQPLELIVALRCLGHLRDPSGWEHLVWHYHHPRLTKNQSAGVRHALVDAIVSYGGQPAVKLLQQPVDYFYVSAWGLVRCGKPAIPAIVKIIEGGRGPNGPRHETMFRSYLSHWDKLTSPVDPRVVQAVRNSMKDVQIKAFRTQHHREFLAKVAKSKRFPWGKPVAGISARLRPKRLSWPTNRAVQLKADIRNLGQRPGFVIRSAMAHHLEVDGIRYRVKTGGGKSSPLNPGSFYSNLSVELTQNWGKVTDGSPLKLSIGKHQVRFIFRVGSNGREQTEVISNTVKFSIRG